MEGFGDVDVHRDCVATCALSRIGDCFVQIHFLIHKKDVGFLFVYLHWPTISCYWGR
jgi:hypothetical protein